MERTPDMLGGVMQHGLSEDDWERGEWERDRRLERGWAKEDSWPTWRIVRGDGRVEFIRAIKVTSVPQGDDEDKLDLRIWGDDGLMRTLPPHSWRSAALLGEQEYLDLLTGEEEDELTD